MTFKDHFSQHANVYSRYRPSYPWAMFRWLAAQLDSVDTVWDCATGNGQAAHDWAHVARRVIATDASANQIHSAVGHPRITFRCASAEHSGLDDHSVDIVSVAQALHWFDQPAFYTEARRVLRPGGILAVWTYRLCRVSAAIDPILRTLAWETLDSYWPPERDHVENEYRGILPNWQPLATPRFDVRADWTLEQLLGYLSSWSSVQRCRRMTGHDPLAELHEPLRQLWGDGRRMVSWPLVWFVYRKPG